jgi:hypothetical protein
VSPSVHLRTETDPVSETWLSNFLNSGRWTKSRAPAILKTGGVLWNSTDVSQEYIGSILKAEKESSNSELRLLPVSRRFVASLLLYRCLHDHRWENLKPRRGETTSNRRHEEKHRPWRPTGL